MRCSRAVSRIPGPLSVARAKQAVKIAMRCAQTWLCALLVLLSCVAVANAAEGIQVKSAELVLVDDVYQLNAEVSISLGALLEDAVRRGVPLHFVMEFEAQRARDFWFDEDLAEVSRAATISYNALLRQFQVAIGSQYRQTDTLPEALDQVSRIENWPVLDRRLLKKRFSYKARVRVRLDVSHLPKPLQVSAITSRKWDLDSQWHEWSFGP
jgi:hypothetical protein